MDRETSTPLVSVVLIFLNAHKYISEAIESVVAQTYGNWELLLVDDGSSDESTAQCLEHERGNPRQIRYFEHEGHRNLGTGASRHLGISHARGDYVTFIDADDVWLPDKLVRQVQVLDAHPAAALTYGRDLYWHSWNPQSGKSRKDCIPQLGVPSNVVIPPPKLVPLFLLGKAAVPCINFLIRRSAIQRVGGLPEPFRGLYEDQVLWTKVLLHEGAVAIDECWAKYRQHSESICATDRTGRNEQVARQKFLNWLEDYLRVQQIKDPAVWRALREAQRLLRYPAIARVLRSIRRRLGAIGM